jgi:hypothetical protein
MMDDDDEEEDEEEEEEESGVVGGMSGRRNRSARRKPAPVLLCTPQIPLDLGSNLDRRGGKLATNRKWILES